MYPVQLKAAAGVTPIEEIAIGNVTRATVCGLRMQNRLTFAGQEAEISGDDETDLEVSSRG